MDSENGKGKGKVKAKEKKKRGKKQSSSSSSSSEESGETSSGGKRYVLDETSNLIQLKLMLKSLKLKTYFLTPTPHPTLISVASWLCLKSLSGTTLLKGGGWRGFC